MQTSSYVPRADALVVAADTLQAAALDLVDEWEEAAWIGDAATRPSDEAIEFWQTAERLYALAVEIAEQRKAA